MKRRVLSLMMALVIFFTMLPTSALAQDTETPAASAPTVEDTTDVPKVTNPTMAPTAADTTPTESGTPATEGDIENVPGDATDGTGAPANSEDKDAGEAVEYVAEVTARDGSSLGQFTSLKEAVEEARSVSSRGSTVKLLSDTMVTEYIQSGKYGQFTIDLGGYTVTATSTDCFGINGTSANVTIKNGKLAGNDTVVEVSAGKVTLENVTATVARSGYPVLVLDGAAEIHGGECGTANTESGLRVETRAENKVKLYGGTYHLIIAPAGFSYSTLLPEGEGYVFMQRKNGSEGYTEYIDPNTIGTGATGNEVVIRNIQVAKCTHNGGADDNGKCVWCGLQHAHARGGGLVCKTCGQKLVAYDNRVSVDILPEIDPYDGPAPDSYMVTWYYKKDNKRFQLGMGTLRGTSFAYNQSYVDFSGTTIGDTLDVSCIIRAEDREEDTLWQTVITGYTLTVTRGQAEVTKAPAAIENLTYTGGAQALTTRGLSKVGEMQYSLDGNAYSTDIPTGTDAGTYTVWYKAVGGSDYYDSEPQSITVTIAPKTVANPTISVADCTYNGQAQEPTVTVKDDLGNIIAPKEYEVSYSDNTNAGAGRVIVTDVAGGSYVIKSSAKGFPIDKAAAPTNIRTAH